MRTWGRWLAVILAVLGLVIIRQKPDGKLHMVFCDVGQGDAILLVEDNFEVLVDTGQKKVLLDECLREHLPFWDRTLEGVYITHTDRDHNGLVEELKKNYRVDRWFTDSAVGDLLRYKKLQIETIAGAEPGADGRVLGSNTDNKDSVVLKVSQGNFSAMLTGDLGQKAELALLDRGVLEKTTVLKVGHHGSKYSSGLDFLEQLKPELAVISVGQKNNYGHPNGEVLMRLETVGAKVFRTDQLGTIEVVSDGVETGVLTRKK